MSALEEGVGSVGILQILMFPICGKECIQFLAHLRGDVGICRDRVIRIDAIKQLVLNIVTKCTFIPSNACLCELVEHVFEGSISVCFGFDEYSEAAKTTRGLLLCLELEE